MSLLSQLTAVCSVADLSERVRLDELQHQVKSYASHPLPPSDAAFLVDIIERLATKLIAVANREDSI